MAIILQMTYSKKLGLPNYSSHQCSVSLQAEIADVSQIAGESKRLYALMQESVDREMQEVGYLPDATTYGMHHSESEAGSERKADRSEAGVWRCSDKQRQLIEKIVAEKELDKRDVEDLALERFGVGVKELNRLQASGLIDELLERNGDSREKGGRRDSSRSNRGRFPRERKGASR